MQEKLRPTALKMLNEVVEYFGEDPVNRRSKNQNGCKYLAPDDKPLSKGCAIGMYISDENVKKALDDVGDIGEVFGEGLDTSLPDWMQSLGAHFLKGVQDLHDGDRYWSPIKGLSVAGKEKVKDIIESINFPNGEGK
jgi:hypothetical protein